MALHKRITKHGNSYAVILDKALIDLLGFDVNEPLEFVSLDGSSLTIRQAPSKERERLLDKACNAVDKRYGKAMKRLAE